LDGSPTNAVYEYDPGTQQWNEGRQWRFRAARSPPRLSTERIHAVGGLSAPTVAETPDQRLVAATAAARRSNAGLSAAAVGQQLYVIGCRTNGRSGNELGIKRPMIRQTTDGKSAPTMPTARSGSAGGCGGGRVFVVGGEASSQSFNRVEAYDPRANAGHDYAAMPTARRGLAAVEVDGKLYVIAGGATRANQL